MADPATERVALADRLARQEDLDDATVAAMKAVPRHEFVPEEQQDRAYEDTPLPIGEGQTISAPHMVAIMTDLLALEPGMDVLEIGTGCGYHAAVTAEAVGDDGVYSVEYHDELAAEARSSLAALGYEQVSIRAGDGKQGWAAHAPYDRVYLTCAASSIPDPLVDQLRPGALLLAPVGDRRQRLIRARKTNSGDLDREEHGFVRFVPLQ